MGLLNQMGKIVLESIITFLSTAGESMRIRQNTGRSRIPGVLLGGLMAILKLKKEKMHMASKGDVFGVLQ